MDNDQANKQKEARVLSKEVQAKELLQIILAMNSSARRDPRLRDVINNLNIL